MRRLVGTTCGCLHRRRARARSLGTGVAHERSQNDHDHARGSRPRAKASSSAGPDSPRSANRTPPESAELHTAYDPSVTGDTRLNVRRLAVLHELAERGSIAAVADALWMTPSAVSQHLARLERETGMPLIEKAGRGVRLTAAGQVLAEHGGRVMAALDEANAALQALRTTPGGRVRLASFPSVVQHVLPPIVAEPRTPPPA